MLEISTNYEYYTYPVPNFGPTPSYHASTLSGSMTTGQFQWQYGCYVMPILHGDRLIGRIDPEMDRGKEVLKVNAVYAESDAPVTEKTGKMVADAINELGSFLGAKEIVYGKKIPTRWKSQLS